MKSYLKRLFAGGPKRLPTHRKPTSAPLSLEALEAREVLSASPGPILYLPPVLSYNLDANGNLSQFAILKQTPVDSGVRQFTVAKGVLYDLHSDGRVMEMVGGKLQQVHSGASALVSDAQGDVFALDFSSQKVFQLPASGPAVSVSPGGLSARALVRDSAGTVFALFGDGSVREHNQGKGPSWTGIDGSDTGLVSDLTGNVFALHYANGSGTVRQHVPGAGASWGAVTSSGFSDLVSDIGGNVLALGYGNGTVWQHTPGGAVTSAGFPWSTVSGTAYSDLISDATGKIFALKTDGSLWVRIGSSWEYTLGAVQQINAPGGSPLAVQLQPGLSASLAVQAGTGTLTVSLTNVQLDASALSNNVIAPIMHAVQEVTQPLEKVAEFLITPLPVLSDVSHQLQQNFGVGSGQDVTLASLTGHPEIDTAARSIIAINHLSVPSSNGLVNLGSVTLTNAHPTSAGPLTVVSSQLLNGPSQINSTFGSFEQRARIIGLDFPILDDPSKLGQLLAGNTVPLFTETLPTINVSLSTNSLLFNVPTPIGVTVNVNAQERIDLHLGATFGCDSSGLRTGNLLSGFFVQNVVCGISLNADLTGQANVSAAGLNVQGGLHAEANLTLKGPGASSTISGASLASGAVSAAATGTVNASADGSVWVDANIPFVGTVQQTADLFHVQPVSYSF
jgi:hypothetical protein